MSNQSKTKSVSFSNVNIREYEITICDHPETSVGPSISLGWKYNENLSFNMNTYELIKDAKGRRDCKNVHCRDGKERTYCLNLGFRDQR